MSPVNARDDRLLNRTQMLLRGLYSSGLCVMYHDAGLNVRLVENTPPEWPAPDDVLARGDVAIFDPETAERVIDAKRGVLATGMGVRVEAAIHPNGGEAAWFELDIEADRDAGGGINGLFVSATDITQMKRREETLRSLLFEVSHRSRNLLAILQSILGHTARNSDSIAAFERKFRGRIASLALSQDLVTFSNWQGVRFRRLVEGQLDRFSYPGIAPQVISGDDPMLAPSSALHVGLAVHELAANSASFGALGSSNGAISIEAGVSGEGLRLCWNEELAHAQARGPARESVGQGGTPGGPLPGFGRAILEQVVPRAVNGRATYQIEPDRITYRLEWPEKSQA